MTWPWGLVAAGVAACFAINCVAAALVPRVASVTEGSKAHRMASHACVCLVHNALVTAATMRLVPWRRLLSGEDVWRDPVPGFDLPAGLSAGFFLYDLLQYKLWEPFSLLLVAHHVLSFACWTCAVDVTFAQPWIAYYMFTELSSVFLSSRTILGQLGDRNGPAYAATTGLFGASFFFVRTVPIPFLARAWLRHPPLGAVACGPTRTAQTMGWMSILPLFLNSFWSVALVRKRMRDRSRAERARAEREKRA